MNKTITPRVRPTTRTAVGYSDWGVAVADFRKVAPSEWEITKFYTGEILFVYEFKQARAVFLNTVAEWSHLYQEYTCARYPDDFVGVENGIIIGNTMWAGMQAVYRDGELGVELFERWSPISLWANR